MAVVKPKNKNSLSFLSAKVNNIFEYGTVGSAYDAALLSFIFASICKSSYSIWFLGSTLSLCNIFIDSRR